MTWANGIGTLTVVIPAGSDGRDVDFSAVDDALRELTEGYTLTVDSVSGDGGFEVLEIDPANDSVTGTITDNDPPPLPIKTLASVDETALDLNKDPADLAAGTAKGTQPGSTRETTTGTVTGIAAGWTIEAVDKGGAYGSFSIAANGSFTYTLTSPPDVAGASTTDTLSYRIYNAVTNEYVTNTVEITIYDDGPVVSDTNGLLKNAVGQTLEDVIVYNLGADGLGGISGLSYTGPALKSHDLNVLFQQEDSGGDGLRELVGYADADGDGVIEAGDKAVIRLAADAGSGVEGSYSLELLDVLDQVRPTQTITWSEVNPGGPTTSIPVGDDLIIYAIGNTKVKPSSDYIGTDGNTIDDANGGSPDESIGYDFKGELVNGVKLTIFDTGSGNDVFSWRALDKDGNWVSGSSSITVLDGSTVTPEVFLEGGYSKLEITVTQGSLKVSGLTYELEGDPIPLNLSFGYEATDGDGDKVQGSFSVTADVDVTTGLLNGTLQTTSHLDHKIDPSTP